MWVRLSRIVMAMFPINKGTFAVPISISALTARPTFLWKLTFFVCIMVGLLQWIKTTCAAAEACMLHTKYLTFSSLDQWWKCCFSRPETQFSPFESLKIQQKVEKKPIGQKRGFLSEDEVNWKGRFLGVSLSLSQTHARRHTHSSVMKTQQYGQWI